MAIFDANKRLEGRAVHGVSHSLMSWKAVFAGLLVGLLTYAILFTLGVGIGGLTLREVVQDGGGQGLGIGTGIWMVLINVVALFVGGYFAARISNYATPRIGAAQGFVIAAMFFGFMFYQMVSVAGLAGRGVSNVVGSAGGAAMDAVQSPEVTKQIETALGNNVNLKSDYDTVVQGVATRLLRGDRESARNYLAYQAGISPQEAQARIDRLQIQAQGQLKEAGETTAEIIAGLGWAGFIVLLLGTVACCFGGAAGSRANLRHPMDEQDVAHIETARTA
ncbi:MAG TPA: hypothetical protein VFV50_08830 [Bdellovibrionales bacterium]|nr:hypothetical protein [Bdellovibrionales bacterium]